MNVQYSLLREESLAPNRLFFGNFSTPTPRLAARIPYLGENSDESSEPNRIEQT